jgi:hypothetical protein
MSNHDERWTIKDKNGDLCETLPAKRDDVRDIYMAWYNYAPDNTPYLITHERVESS